MYKLDLPLDLKENAAIERRRNQEAQRQSRIFNARVRTIGVSCSKLTSFDIIQIVMIFNTQGDSKSGYFIFIS